MFNVLAAGLASLRPSWRQVETNLRSIEIIVFYVLLGFLSTYAGFCQPLVLAANTCKNMCFSGLFGPFWGPLGEPKWSPKPLPKQEPNSSHFGAFGGPGGRGFGIWESGPGRQTRCFLGPGGTPCTLTPRADAASPLLLHFEAVSQKGSRSGDIPGNGLEAKEKRG